MAFADITRIKNLTTALLNASERTLEGVPIFGTAVSDHARSSLEIEATCINAAMMVGRAICESDSSPFRSEFLVETTLSHGEVIPFHYGDTTVPTITPYAGATYDVRGVRKSLDRIEAYRTNKNSVYSSVAHNAASNGSAADTAGYYDIVNGIFYFTGEDATMLLATFDRTNVVSKLPDALEPTIVKLACSMSKKEGDSSDGIFASWTAEGMADLTAIQAGATAFSPLDDQIQRRGDRT